MKKAIIGFLIILGASSVVSMQVTAGDRSLHRFLASGVVKSAAGNLGTYSPKGGKVSLPPQLNELLKTDKNSAFQQVEAFSDSRGVRYVRLRQYLNGLKVFNSQLILELDKANTIRSLKSSTIPSATASANLALDIYSAINTIMRGELGVDNYNIQSAGEQGYAIGYDELGYPAWRFRISYLEDSGHENLIEVTINAENGSLLYTQGLIQHAFQSEISNFSIGASHIVMINNIVQPRPDGVDSIIWNLYKQDAQRVYPNVRKVDAYYRSSPFNRDSFDNNGKTYESAVYCLGFCEYPAYSPVSDKVMFPPGPLFPLQTNGGVSNIDIIAHEITHGVTKYSAGLLYEHESGAINEFISDAFAAALDRDTSGNSGLHIWKIAEGWVNNPMPLDALRYMYDPAITCIPNNPFDHCDQDYYPDRLILPITDDNGGIHFNSGIGNLGFYLLSQGGTHPRGKTTVYVPGIGFDKAIHILYHALTTNMPSAMSGFSELRNATAESARELYASQTNVLDSVCLAWDAVGLPNDGTECTLPIPEVPAPAGITVSTVPGICNIYFCTLPRQIVSWDAVVVPGYNTYYEYDFNRHMKGGPRHYAGTTTDLYALMAWFSGYQTQVSGTVRACIDSDPVACSDYTSFDLLFIP